MSQDKEKDGKTPLFSESELRIIALSLCILSLGLAIAYIGLVFFLNK